MATPPRDATPWPAIRKALARTKEIETVLELPVESLRVAGSLTAAGYRVIPTDLRPARLFAAEALPLGTRSVDCVLFAGPVPGDAETRRRLLREFGRVARYVLVGHDAPRKLHRDFEDAGLRVVASIPLRRFPPDGRRVVLAQAGDTHPEALALRLKGTQYADLAILETLGEGKRSVVYRARWRGRDVGVKVYKPAAIASHARKHPLPLAEFEYRRNRAFFEAPGLARFVAEPLGCVVEPGFQMSLQELVDGQVYYFARRSRADYVSPRFREELEALVRLSHEAGLYDIDLHAMNVMVDRLTGSPKLFDFNQIPFHERPPNPFAWLGLKLGLLGRGARDLRKLAEFDDFERIERRLLKFYDSPDGKPAGH